MEKVFIIRIADNSNYVKREIKSGHLRQGWGSADLDLRQSEGCWVMKECQGHDGSRDYYTRKYRNLRKMLEVSKGDILIIPKVPNPWQFTICKASGEYDFIAPEGFSGDDFWHLIPIDIQSIQEWDYTANEMCCNIVKAFSAYRSPVNRVWNESIKVNAERLLSEESINEGKSISSIIEDITSDVLEHNDFLQRVRNLGWKNIERLVNKLFERQGYTLLKQNSADGQGGDADLIYNDNLVPELFDVSENGENVSGKIFVQIKNKTGVDESDITGIQQVIQRAQDETIAIKILISTADSFTETCKKMANENGVLLISGKGLMKLILKYLD